MLLKELFTQDPSTFDIPNQGVAKVNAALGRVLEFELKTFVCEAQYAKGIEDVLSSFLSCLSGDRDQKAAWVSGFYGSGKSHMVKVLAHLWRDTRLDGGTARGLVDLPDEPRRLLTELSTRARQFGGLHAVVGDLKAGVGDGAGVKDIRTTLAGLVLQSVDLPANVSQGRLALRLRRLGVLERVRNRLVEAGESVEGEFSNLRVSIPLHEAILAETPAFGSTRAEVRDSLRAEYPTQVELSHDDVVFLIEEALGGERGLPLTLVVLDELQQFIGESSDRAFSVQDVVEGICKDARMGNRVLFVATGQSAMSETPQLQRLQARFLVRVNLRDADVERVVRKVVLEKRPAAQSEIRAKLSARAGEIDRQLVGTKVAPRPDDASVLVADYPLLPARRRFWERALRALDRANTQALLRSQLGLVNRALRPLADRPLGALIPADALYFCERENMLQSGALARDEDDLIARQGPESSLRARLCALAFLVGKIPRDPGADTGIRARAGALTELLVDDLDSGYDALYPQVEAALAELVRDGDLAVVEGEYRLQTPEIAAWSRELNDRALRIKNDVQKIGSLRTEALQKAVEEALKTFRPTQGATKTARRLALHFGPEAPPVGDGVPVWVRDGWGESEANVRRNAVDAGLESPTLFAFLPNVGDGLRDALAAAEAAKELMEARASAQGDDVQQARAATRSRAEEARDAVATELRRVVEGARVFQGGGTPVAAEGLRPAVEAGVAAALKRLYPRFSPEADSPAWATVVKRAREGNDAALTALGYEGSIEEHPVTRAVLQFVGAGRKGSAVLAEFEGGAYGWPTDTITGALLALVAANKVQATFLQDLATAKTLDGQRLKGAEFRTEQVPLGVKDKIALRGLMQRALGPVESGDEVDAARRFLARLDELAAASGGEAPAPAAERPAWIAELRATAGNARLAGLLTRKDEIEALVKRWEARGKTLESRRVAWVRLVEFLALAGALPEAAEVRREAEAILKDRLLLAEPDPVRPLLDRLTLALRSALRMAQDASAAEFDRLYRETEGNEIWERLPREEWAGINAAVGLHAILPFDDATDAVGDDGLADALRERSLAHWESVREALPARFARAAAEAARRLEPTSVAVALPKRLLRDVAEVDAYLAEVRASLVAKVAEGPVRVS